MKIVAAYFGKKSIVQGFFGKKPLFLSLDYLKITKASVLSEVGLGEYSHLLRVSTLPIGVNDAPYIHNVGLLTLSKPLAADGDRCLLIFDDITEYAFYQTTDSKYLSNASVSLSAEITNDNTISLIAFEKNLDSLVYGAFNQTTNLVSSERVLLDSVKAIYEKTISKVNDDQSLKQLLKCVNNSTMSSPFSSQEILKAYDIDSSSVAEIIDETNRIRHEYRFYLQIDSFTGYIYANSFFDNWELNVYIGELNRHINKVSDSLNWDIDARWPILNAVSAQINPTNSFLSAPCSLTEAQKYVEDEPLTYGIYKPIITESFLEYVTQCSSNYCSNNPLFIGFGQNSITVQGAPYVNTNFIILGIQDTFAESNENICNTTSIINTSLSNSGVIKSLTGEIFMDWLAPNRLLSGSVGDTIGVRYDELTNLINDSAEESYSLTSSAEIEFAKAEIVGGVQSTEVRNEPLPWAWVVEDEGKRILHIERAWEMYSAYHYGLKMNMLCIDPDTKFISILVINVPKNNYTVNFYLTQKYGYKDEAADSRVTIDFGDGEIGSVISRGMSHYAHLYKYAGTYTVQFRAPYPNFWSPGTGFYSLTGVCSAIQNSSTDSKGKTTTENTYLVDYTYTWANHFSETKEETMERGANAIGAPNSFTGNRTNAPEIISFIFGETARLESDNMMAFYGSSNLTNVVLPKNISYIPHNTFTDCVRLNIEIPNTVHTIGREAFRGCRSLNTRIPNSVTRIEKNAFDTSGMQVELLSNNIEVIEHNAFSNCQKIEVLEIAAKCLDKEEEYERTTIAKRYDKETGKTEEYEVILPRRNLCFSDCYYIRRVWIRETCENILFDDRDGAPFVGCPSGMVIYAEPDSKPYGWCDDFNYLGDDRYATVIWGRKTSPLCFVESNLCDGLTLNSKESIVNEEEINICAVGEYSIINDGVHGVATAINDVAS